MTELEKTSLEIVRFMRGHYRLDEIPGMFYDAPCVRFRQGTRTIVTINLRQDFFEFLIVLGKAEREKFEAVRHEFPDWIQQIYDQQPALHDGKWLFLRVENRGDFEQVKRLILFKKKPNRKPFSKEGAVWGKCGHRCDLCVHSAGISEAFRNQLIPHLDAVYGQSDWSMRCTGCATPGCQCYAEGAEICEPLKCLNERKLDSCFDCSGYPCKEATVGYRSLEPRLLSADDVTWGILPYVPRQYEESSKNKE